MSGAVAFRKLQQLAQPAVLADVIRRLNYDPKTDNPVYDARSCYMNNVAVVKTLTNQAIPRSIDASSMTGVTALTPAPGMNGQHTEAVMRSLAAGNIVAFGLQFRKTGGGGAGDHYFSAFALDGGTVIVSMGWQGLYDFSEWFAQNDSGRFARDKFKALIRQIEDGDVEGVNGLCGFLGVTRDGRGIPLALAGETAGCKPRFVGTCSLKLPGS